MTRTTINYMRRRRLRSSNVDSRYIRVWGSKNSRTSGPSIIHRCWTASLEQRTYVIMSS